MSLRFTCSLALSDWLEWRGIEESILQIWSSSHHLHRWRSDLLWDACGLWSVQGQETVGGCHRWGYGSSLRQIHNFLIAGSDQIITPDQFVSNMRDLNKPRDWLAAPGGCSVSVVDETARFVHTWYRTHDNYRIPFPNTVVAVPEHTLTRYRFPLSFPPSRL